jgi:secondary thiamine-phosphate synthase enzyme
VWQKIFTFRSSQHSPANGLSKSHGLCPGHDFEMVNKIEFKQEAQYSHCMMDENANETARTTRAQSFSQANHSLTVRTRGAGFTDITQDIREWLEQIGARAGLLTVFISHTSASLTIQENADPDVRHDLTNALNELAPESVNYRHSMEGPDDMPAHIKAMLTSVSLSIPVFEGRTALGTWQGIFVIEHRARPHERKVELHFVGVRQTSAF